MIVKLMFESQSFIRDLPCICTTQEKGRDPAVFLLQPEPSLGTSWSIPQNYSFILQSMAGSDIAELLMQDCKKLEKYKRQPPVANLINLTDEDWPVQSSGTRNLLTGEIPPNMDTPAQIVEKFTKLLYYGRKKVRKLFPQASDERPPSLTPSPAPPMIWPEYTSFRSF